MKRDKMTTEEIEKAGKRYAYNIIPDENGMTFPVERSELSKAFKAGVEFSDKHWQEKTRWKSLKKEPPKFNGEPFYITIKHGGSGIVTGRVISDKTIGYFIEDGFVEYKMI